MPFTDQLLAVLVRDNVMSAQDAEHVVSVARSQGKPVDAVVTDQKLVSPLDLAAAKGEVYGLGVVDLMNVTVPRSVLDFLPEELASHYGMVPIRRQADVLTVAMADAGNFKAREAMEFVARNKGLSVRFVVTTPEGMTQVLRQYSSGVVAAALETVGDATVTGVNVADEETLEAAPVAKIVSVIMKHAVEGGASDIHIEPASDQTRVRFRVDGVLHTSLLLPRHVHQAVVSRIKVLASLKLDETRVPQDGRIRLKFDEHTYDFRVSTLPLLDAEKVVMRILNTTQGPPDLNDLGFDKVQLEIMNQRIREPAGMILVVGPTGSGKSTTLFALLKILNGEGINIMTLEDPIEYYVEGINQSQVRAEVGFTFATGLRSLLRQDPNVIMVGEIRDRETADLAIHAGLTGHVVLSTLHTNDALGVVPRLLDMNIEPFLISSTLTLVVAQRLVRKICPDCILLVQATPDFVNVVRHELADLVAEVFVRYGLSVDSATGRLKEPFEFAKGRGCNTCSKSGYKGRTTIAEVLNITPSIREVISHGNDQTAVASALKAEAFLTLRQVGLLKALAHITTIEEVLIATRED